MIVSFFCFINSICFSISNFLDKSKYCIFPEKSIVELIPTNNLKLRINKVLEEEK
jgi:hypothetical protein